MECYRHPGVVPTATCVACSQPICPECQEEVAGHAMCHPCVTAAAARLSAEGDPASPAAPNGSANAPTEGTVPAADSAPLAHTLQPEPALHGPAAPAKELVRPGLARRIARGMLWGVLYGQWWTAWTIASEFMWGHASLDAKMVLIAIVLFVVYGFAGSLTGLVIGAANASMGTGMAIGVGAGLLLCGLEALLTHDPGSLINVIFYFFTGRFVGVGITWRVQQPVRRRSALERG
jgi:hypothetical protein